MVIASQHALIFRIWPSDICMPRMYSSTQASSFQHWWAPDCMHCLGEATLEKGGTHEVDCASVLGVLDRGLKYHQVALHTLPC